MVTFDLSDILKDSKLPDSFELLNELSHKLSIQSSEYISNIRNLTTGIVPTEGELIANLPSSDNTQRLIKNHLLEVDEDANACVVNICYDNVWQLLISSGVLPLGWMYKNVAYPQVVYKSLYATYKTILVGNRGTNGPLINSMESFGLVVRNIAGHNKKKISFFATYDNQLTCAKLESILRENNIDDIVLMSEEEYAKNLVDTTFYRFLVRFDKIISPINGTILKAKVDLNVAVPTYLLKVGCANSIIMASNENSIVKNYRFGVINFKRGMDVFTTVYVPNNFMITSVSLNGTTYYVGTNEIDAVGISVTETDIYQKTGYKVFIVNVSGLTNSAEIFIDACEDFTGRTITRGIVSTNKSTLVVTDTETTINLIFNKPFHYLNTNKVRLWARKDDDSDEVLVQGATFISDNCMYVEKKAVFSSKPNCNDQCIITRNNLEMNETVYCTHFDMHSGSVTPGKDIVNEPVNDCLKPVVTPNEKQLTDSVFIWGVTECGRLLITCDGYSKFKYFRVEFEDRAMIVNYKIAGRIDDLTIIPVIEDMNFINHDHDNEPDVPEGPGTGGGSGSGPDYIIGGGLGFTFED